MAAVLLSVPAFAQNKLQTPTEFFGFKPGTDRQLFTHEKLIDYFKLLDKNQAPFFFILPTQQHDQSELIDLVKIMHEQGINIYRLTKDVTVNNYQFHKGDVVFPMNQAYRPFIKEVMETQTYPVRLFTPGGKIIRPYDITSWSLPLHKGLESHEIDI